jgi:hypothetical protein
VSNGAGSSAPAVSASARWTPGNAPVRLRTISGLGWVNVMVQTRKIRIKKRLINPNEKQCPACDGTGAPAAIQPVQPGRRIYPPPCGECDGEGWIPKADG